MSEWFTEEELDRISRFAASPGYSRDPTMLLPDSDADESSDTEDAGADEALGTERGASAAETSGEE